MQHCSEERATSTTWSAMCRKRKRDDQDTLIVNNIISWTGRNVSWERSVRRNCWWMMSLLGNAVRSIKHHQVLQALLSLRRWWLARTLNRDKKLNCIILNGRFIFLIARFLHSSIQRWLCWRFDRPGTTCEERGPAGAWSWSGRQWTPPNLSPIRSSTCNPERPENGKRQEGKEKGGRHGEGKEQTEERQNERAICVWSPASEQDPTNRSLRFQLATLKHRKQQEEGRDERKAKEKGRMENGKKRKTEGTTQPNIHSDFSGQRQNKEERETNSHERTKWIVATLELLGKSMLGK